MYVDKLKKLQKLLSSTKVSKHFDLEFWFDNSNDVNSYKDFLETGKCNTTACVAGWATNIIPELSMVIDNWDCVHVVNTETNASDFQAFADAFDIDYSAAEYICDPVWYEEGENLTEVENAIEHIDKVIDGTWEEVVGKLVS